MHTPKDHNKLQAFGRVKEVLGLHPLVDKWRSFNFMVLETDGHDVKKLCKSLDVCGHEGEKPQVIIAHTVKGKGLSFMEDLLEWHYLPIKGEFIDIALKEVGG